MKSGWIFGNPEFWSVGVARASDATTGRATMAARKPRGAAPRGAPRRPRTMTSLLKRIVRPCLAARQPAKKRQPVQSARGMYYI